MGYNVNDSVVRADRFKPSGKWYDSRALDMSSFYDEPLVHDAVRKAMMLTNMQLEEGWMLVVLEPYHVNSHPVILKG